MYLSIYLSVYIYLSINVYIYLFRERSQSISVLRVIEFSEMTKPNVHLLRTILCEVLLMENLEDMQNIFQVRTTARKRVQD